jgi:large subunit ribosomal protein L4
LVSVLETLQTNGKTLVVDSKSNDKLRLSIRNAENKQFLPPEGVNVYDLLRHDHVVLSKEAIKEIEARCSEGAEA